jgi:hypothetical protein
MTLAGMKKRENSMRAESSSEERRKVQAGITLVQRTQRKRRRHLYFAELERESQLQAFFAWLPQELHDAPGIDWTKLPPRVMGYCVHTIGESPDAASLAMALAAALGGMKQHTLYHTVMLLNGLLRRLRSQGYIEHLSDLQKEQIWRDWLAKTKRTEGTRKPLKVYVSISTEHYPRYLQRLSTQDRLRMQAYALPSLPVDLLQSLFPHQGIKVAAQAKRKAQSDILVPLYPVLRQLIRFRKQLAERTLSAIREARRKVEAGEAVLPFSFTHADTIPEINRDARTVSEVKIHGREVTMHFTLWDKPTWLIHHQERVGWRTIKAAHAREGAYSPEQNILFVQFQGSVSDLLWFGDLIEYRLLQSFKREEHEQPGYEERWQLARSLGYSAGCHCVRPGLLNPSDQWLTDSAMHRNGDFVFEPESLYRGVLFGAALAMIALSNGSRMSELLQVSWNKERRITRIETVRVLGEDGLPITGADGKPVTKQVPIYLQHLLPKGAKTEEERQLFPLSKESMRLIGEIKRLLEAKHGEIPFVQPSRSSAKYEDLKPERYLFQWEASSDGTIGILPVQDVQVLIRFILHGLDLYTSKGEPIRVSVHLLRHVMATHARQIRHVPPEVVAHFFLHHRLRVLTGRNLSPSDVSEYYTLMTEDQQLTIIREDLEEMEEIDRALLMAAPSPRNLEQMEDDIRAVYEMWHALHPTVFGNCGCPGLCPRGIDRALCLGCSYLVTDPEKLGAALIWRNAYAKQAEMLEAQGNLIDARQARIKVQQLDDIINMMRLQLQAEADGRHIPFFRKLPSPDRQKETREHDEEDR